MSELSWVKQKMLVTSFTQNVFYPVREKFHYCSHIKVVVYKCICSVLVYPAYRCKFKKVVLTMHFLCLYKGALTLPCFSGSFCIDVVDHMPRVLAFQGSNPAVVRYM